ncbi:hypothetical protein BN2537_2937 [Streptomyces venezuelae]|nr:hypothetical protein BN2537_2937 [Streptomyces venezuelae]
MDRCNIHPGESGRLHPQPRVRSVQKEPSTAQRLTWRARNLNRARRAGQACQVPHADLLRPVVNELQEQQKKHGNARTAYRRTASNA